MIITPAFLICEFVLIVFHIHNCIFSCSEIYEERGFSNFCQQLWDLDENRLVEDKDYKLDLGGRTRYSVEGIDNAKDPLFTWVKPDVFERPTYKGICGFYILQTS